MTFMCKDKSIRVSIHRRVTRTKNEMLMYDFKLDFNLMIYFTYTL